MGVADRGADLQEQLQALGHRQVQVPGVVGDRLALHVVQGQVGLAVLADAGVEQAGDVGMAEAGQDLPLAVEALAQAGVAQAGAQQLQRDPALVEAVVADGQPDLAHAAFAQQPLQLVGADDLAGLGREHGGVHHRFAEEIRALVLQCQQALEFVGDRGIVGTDLGQAARAELGIELQQLVQQGG